MSGREEGESGGHSPGPGAGGGAGTSRVQHPRSFKLRFAAPREPGRSYVSLVKPLGLPATVTGKFHTEREEEEDAEGTQRALARIQRMFQCAPRDLHAAPITSAHEYGWWWAEGLQGVRQTRGDRRLAHHVRDSAWMQARLQVLAADDKLKHK